MDDFIYPDKLKFKVFMKIFVKFYYFELSLDFNPFMHECENLRKVTKPRINFRFRSKMFRWTTRGCIYAKMSRAKLPSNTGLS